MKSIAWYVIGAVVLAALGGLCLGWSRLDRSMASAEQTLITADYDAADASLQGVESYSEFVRRVPVMGTGVMNDLRTRRAAINYWRGAYGALVPAGRTDPVADIPADNVPLQVIVADSVYRAGQPAAKDRAAIMRLLESSIGAYRTVLSNARRPEDVRRAETAAYNYEYLVRVRNEMVSGKRRALPAPPDEHTFGSEGKPEIPQFDKEFKQYVPLQKEERDNADKGKAPPPVRKG